VARFGGKIQQTRVCVASFVGGKIMFIEYITISIPIVLSALGVIISIVALMLGIKIIKIEKYLVVLEKHKHILISQMVLCTDNEMIRGYKALEIIKEAYKIKDDYQALELYYNLNKKEGA
jgi:hypothetical protein